MYFVWCTFMREIILYHYEYNVLIFWKKGEENYEVHFLQCHLIAHKMQLQEQKKIYSHENTKKTRFLLLYIHSKMPIKKSLFSIFVTVLKGKTFFPHKFTFVWLADHHFWVLGIPNFLGFLAKGRIWGGKREREKKIVTLSSFFLPLSLLQSIYFSGHAKIRRKEVMDKHTGWTNKTWWDYPDYNKYENLSEIV